MLGLSRCERRLGIALPVVFLSSGLLILLSSTAFRLWGSPAAYCFTPQEFTPNWAEYAHQVCSTRSSRHFPINDTDMPQLGESQFGPSITDKLMAPGKWADKQPRRLFLCAIILAVPLLLAELMGRAVEVTGKPQTGVGIAVRALGILLARVTFIICLGVVLSMAGADSDPQGASPSDGSIFICEMRLRKLGRGTMRYALQCVWKYGGQMHLAVALLFLLWTCVASVLLWAVVGTVETVVLLVYPKTRDHALQTAAEEEAKE